MASSAESRKKEEVVQPSDQVSGVSLGTQIEGVDGGTLINMVSANFEGISIEEHMDDEPAC